MSDADPSNASPSGARRTGSEPRGGTPRIPVAGDTLGKYLVLDTLGSGAMGVVVRAYDPDLERSVAIKLVRPRATSSGTDDAARGRLLAEARALARISHPNVLGVYEVGVQDGLIYVAMELVEGVDLERWLRVRKRGSPEIVAAFEAAGRGLAQVHAVGLVHRDVKPANLLVGDDGRVRVGDFGIARAAFELPTPTLPGVELVTDAFDIDTTALTAEGRVVGTPAYMAPEQHLGEDVGPAADQYALCVALYEALWGKRPFNAPVRRLLVFKRAGAPMPPAGHTVPRWLVGVVMRGLAYEPAARFGSMDALCAALRDDPSRRQKRRLAMAGGAVAIAALAGVGIHLARKPGPCEGEASALVGVWDPPTRTAVEQAFARSDRPWAAQAWAQAGPRLDAYAEQWTAMRREACEATHVRGEQTPEQLDRRITCLEVRRRALVAATELLAAGEASAVDHTAELLGGLRPVAPCADPIALASAIELPDDPTLRAEVDREHEALARARALVDAGRYAEAVELAHERVAVARELGYAPLLGEALGFEGEGVLRLGDAAAARAALEAAVWTAIGVGDDEVAADAAANLVFLAGLFERSLPEALRWAALAEASLRRGHSDDPLVRVRLENSLGGAYEDAAQYELALATFERALARLTDDPAFANRAAILRHNIAKLWVDRGDLVRARELLEPTIVELGAVLGPEHPRVVAMRGSLGQVYGAAGDHVRAAELFRAEVEGLTLAMGADAMPVASARSNLAVALADLGDSDASILEGEAALAIFERHGEAGLASTALDNLASELYRRGVYDAAEARFTRALTLIEGAFSDRHPRLLFPLVGLGRIRLVQGRNADALANFERADAIIRGSESASAHERSLALEGKATAMTALGRRDEALAVVVEQIEMLRAGTDVEPDELPVALAHQGRLLGELGRNAEAMPGLDEARTLMDERGLGDGVRAEVELDRARSLAALSRRGEAREAIAVALAAAERNAAADPKLLAEVRGVAASLGD